MSSSTQSNVDQFLIELGFELDAHATRRAQIDLDCTNSRELLFAVFATLGEEHEAVWGPPELSPVVLDFYLRCDEVLALHDEHWDAQIRQEEVQTLLNIFTLYATHSPLDNQS